MPPVVSQEHGGTGGEETPAQLGDNYEGSGVQRRKVHDRNRGRGACPTGGSDVTQNARDQKKHFT